MANPLAALYSAIDSGKRKLKDFVSNPGGSIDRGVSAFREDQNALQNLFANAYPMAGDKTVLNSPEQIAQFQREAADAAANMGMAGMINPVALGLPVNKNGTVTLYHGTTARGADEIVSSKTLKSAGEPNVYLTTSKNAGYGDGSLVQVDVHPRMLNLDDEFPDGRLDFSIDAPNKLIRVASARKAK